MNLKKLLTSFTKGEILLERRATYTHESLKKGEKKIGSSKSNKFFFKFHKNGTIKEYDPRCKLFFTLGSQ
jgi:hypothetical protein